MSHSDLDREQAIEGWSVGSLRSAEMTVNGTFEAIVARLDIGAKNERDLATLLSESERNRAHRFAFDRDRRRYIAARGCLRQLLSMRLGVPPEEVELICGRHGKPALAPQFADTGLRFNVSHAEDLAVYAFSFGREVGIDVEAVRPIANADDIALRFFSPRETKAYLGLDPRDRVRGFFNCWTRKEAFVKAIGDGLHYPLDRFDVALDPAVPARILRVEDTPGEACGWSLDGFEPARGFTAAIVVQTDLRESADVGHARELPMNRTQVGLDQEIHNARPASGRH
jgi:4'-phosphopantetheinyl transferase